MVSVTRSLFALNKLRSLRAAQPNKLTVIIKRRENFIKGFLNFIILKNNATKSKQCVCTKIHLKYAKKNELYKKPILSDFYHELFIWFKSEWRFIPSSKINIKVISEFIKLNFNYMDHKFLGFI